MAPGDGMHPPGAEDDAASRTPTATTSSAKTRRRELRLARAIVESLDALRAGRVDEAEELLDSVLTTALRSLDGDSPPAAHHREIAARGGRATLTRHGLEHYQRMGRRGREVQLERAAQEAREKAGAEKGEA